MFLVHSIKQSSSNTAIFKGDISPVANNWTNRSLCWRQYGISDILLGYISVGFTKEVKWCSLSLMEVLQQVSEVLKCRVKMFRYAVSSDCFLMTDYVLPSSISSVRIFGNRMVWLVYSPHLNPVGNVWNALRRPGLSKIRKRYF